MTLNDLATALSCEPALATKTVNFWVSRGVVVKSNNDTFELVRVLGDKSREGASGSGAGGAGDAAGAQQDEALAQAQAEENEKAQRATVFNRFITGPSTSKTHHVSQRSPHLFCISTGMLMNFQSLSVDKMHNMLRMFVVDPPFNLSLQELTVLLNRLVTEDTLDVDAAGMYSLKNRKQ